MPHKPKAWVRYRRRALAAESQVAALRKAFLSAVGYSIEDWSMLHFAKLSASSPRNAYILTQRPYTQTAPCCA